MNQIKEFIQNKKIKLEIVNLFILISLTLLLSILKINNYIFLLISISSNIFLILLYQFIKKILNIEISKKEKIIILSSILLIYIFYFISILTKNFIYYWDYSCYYNLQTILEESFQNGLISGIKNFAYTTWSGEYGNFLNFFPQIIFNFTNKTIDSYLLSCVVVYIPYIIISFTYLIKVFNRKFKEKYSIKIFGITLSSLILLPLVHSTFIFGQPDVFGISFIFLLLSLILEYDFKKLDSFRLLTLLIITFMLFITRRWYIYFIISIYICYILSLLIKNRKDKELLKIIKNGFIFLIISIIFFLITLFPFIKNVIQNDFTNSYNFYLQGGLIGEIKNQILHIGIIPLILMITGIIYGLINKKYRLITILSLLQYLLIIILFTRIQNMGLHHSLLLITCYLYYLYLFTLLIKNKKSLYIITLIIYIINFSNTLLNYNIKLFSDAPIKTPKQNDYYEIKKVSDWLNENLNNSTKAYMITHNNQYNPDKFRNFYLPNKNIQNNLPYGSAVLGVHKFPTELFDSTYIITSNPYEAISIDEKYNKVFNELVSQNKFELIEKFDMKNGIEILIYKRIKEVTFEETEMYLNEISNETSNYNFLYKDIIDNYVINNNLKGSESQ